MGYPATRWLMDAIFFSGLSWSQPAGHDLRFSSLPRVWDEGLPLGNGMIGALIWHCYFRAMPLVGGASDELIEGIEKAKGIPDLPISLRKAAVPGTRKSLYLHHG